MTAAGVTLIEVGREPYRIGTVTYRTGAGDTPAHALYRAAVFQGLKYDERLSGLFERDNEVQGGEIRVANVRGQYDHWIDDLRQGDPIVILDGDTELAFDQFVRWEGTIVGVEQPSDNLIHLEIGGLGSELDERAQRLVINSGSQIGDMRPICLGGPLNCKPWVTDPDTDPEYIVHEFGGVEDPAVARYINQAASTSPAITKSPDNHLRQIEFDSVPNGVVTVDPRGVKVDGTWVERGGESLKYLLTRESPITVGLVRGGTANTLVGPDWLSDQNDHYNGLDISHSQVSTDGIDAHTWRVVADYDGPTRTFTVDTDWPVVPVEDDGFEVHDAPMQLGPYSPAILDTDAFDAWDSAQTGRIGLYIDDGRKTYAEALAAVVGPYGWYGWIGGKLSLGPVVDPALAAADVTLSEADIIDISIQQDIPPAKRLRVGFARNHTVSRSGSSGDVSPAREAWIKNEYRYHGTEREDLSVLKDYPDAEDEVVDTRYTEAADGAAEADRMWPLIRVQRFHYFITARLVPISLAFVAEITHRHKHFTGGKNVLITGITRNRPNRTMILECWA